MQLKQCVMQRRKCLKSVSSDLVRRTLLRAFGVVIAMCWNVGPLGKWQLQWTLVMTINIAINIAACIASTHCNVDALVISSQWFATHFVLCPAVHVNRIPLVITCPKNETKCHLIIWF